MFKDIIKAILLAFGISFFAAVVAGGAVGTENQGLSAVGLVLFFLSPVIAIWWFRHKRRKNKELAQAMEEAAERDRKNLLRRRFLERQRLIDSIDRHRSALTRNLERAIRKNDYGAVKEDQTEEALLEFFASIDLDFDLIEGADAIEIVFEQIEFRAQEDREAGFDAHHLPFDGHAFERWVAEALVGFGWEAEVTTGSGDQGIDVVALKQGKKIGIQCKLYSHPIGNKAIQEAHAGKIYYNADAAAVLTNASFTRNAKDLAMVTGVLLLSHHDIPHLYEKVFGLPVAGVSQSTA